ncbi:MAG: hypothetical protein K8S98_16800 [Planctomycetes bacterium]|nr:hypothetical protein [Planctomycetota bacterium]
MIHFTRLALCSAAALALADVGRAQATFFPFPQSGTFLNAVTPDGQWFAGADVLGGASFRYSVATGVEFFTSGSSGLPDIAIGGSPVAATLVDTNGNEVAGLWTPSGSTLLPPLTSQSGNSITSAYAANDDASVVVGLGWITAGKARAFKWTQATGTVDLGALGPMSSRANGVSGDGSVVTGWDEDPTGPRRPAYWDATGEHLLGVLGEAWGASQDGRVITGDENGNCFRWTAATGLVDLGKLRGSDPIFDIASGLAVSADGQTIVGSNGNTFFGTPPRAFVWRAGAGMTDLRELLLALGASGAAGYSLSSANCVSADGLTIGGSAGIFFTTNAFTAQLPPITTVYCTAQRNSLGCLPSISSFGTPSARTGAGFHVTASSVLAIVSGQLFYGTSGAVALPFQGGTLCVGGPLERTAVQTSGGSGACDGRFDFDFNKYVGKHSDAALIGGAKVWAQYWSRDNAAPGGSNLTDALEFTLWP